MTSAPGTAWMTDAACATRGHRGLPWLDDTHSVPAVLVEVMRDVCGGCPVLAACAGYVTRAGVTGGFWAGADRDPAATAMQLDLLEHVDLLEPCDSLEPVAFLERDDVLKSVDRLGGAA